MMAFLQNHPEEAQRRRGVTLLELLVVVTLMGILSTVVVSRYGRDIFGDFGARSEGHQLWLDLQKAKALAIRSGSSHSISFAQSGGAFSGYELVQGTAADIRAGRSVTVIGDPVVFSPEIAVNGSPDVVEFNFEGQASAACRIQMKGPNRSWQLTVVPLSGAVNVTEL